ncbi:PAS domain S-box protein [Desulfococcaceae bacterium HSG8]|nr:PAS domain S-box protein [Desulfococcaceae bacterium HSG8]
MPPFIIASAIFLFFTCGNLYAQNNERIDFEHLLTLGVQITDVVQDKEGFFWIATSAGLMRYDGVNIKTFRKGRNSVSADLIWSLYDTDDTLWIGSWKGLDKFDKETGGFTHYVHDPDDPNTLNDTIVNAVYEDRSGIIWVGTRSGGLNRFDPKTGRFKHYLHRPDNPKSLSDNDVIAILEDSAGILWIGTQKGGLNRFDRKTETFTHYMHDPDNPASLSGNSVIAILEDTSGRFWTGTGKGLSRFDRETGTFANFRHDPNDPASISTNSVLHIYEDISGSFWIGTQSGGLNKFDPETGIFTRYQKNPDAPGSLRSDDVQRIYTDRSDILWVFCKSGEIEKYDRKPRGFRLYQHDPKNPRSLSSNVVLPVYEDSGGDIWIGTGTGGLNKFDRETETFVHYKPNPGNPDDPESLPCMIVTAIAEDQNGNFWIGSTNRAQGVLSTFDRNTGKFIKHYRYEPGNPHTIPSTRHFPCILPDVSDSHILWLGTAGNGLIKFDTGKERFTHYPHDPDNPAGIISGRVTFLHQEKSGVIWIATGNGLDKFDKHREAFTHYRHKPDEPKSISDNNILSILETASGILWIGTGSGLNRFDRDTETFRRYTTDDGLPDSHIYAIFEDESGNLWMSTNGGIVKFNPDTGMFRNYTKNDGLQGDAFYYFAYCQTRDGEIWFGGLNGVNRFNPEDVMDNPHIPNVVLTSLNQGGTAILGLGKSPVRLRELELDWRTNFFEFEFAGLEYTRPGKNQYAYMLEGLDKDWYYAGTRRFGRYTSLPDGTYTLRIIGANNDGLWNEKGVSVKITVKPPFRRTWWFRIFIFLSLIGAAAAVFWFSIRIIRHQKTMLEAQMAERTIEFQESEKRFRALSEATFEGIIIHENGLILDVNQSVSRMYGFDRPELIGKNIFDLMAPEVRKSAEENLLIAYEQPYESVGKRKDGSFFPVEFQAKAIPYYGRNVSAAAIRDITWRKQTEEQLLKSEEEYRVLFENLQDVFFRVDTDGDILLISPSLVQLLGYLPEEVTGWNIGEHLYASSEKWEKFRSAMEEDGFTDGFEAIFKTRDGSEVWGSVSSQPYTDDQGKILGFEGTIRDISENKEAEVSLLTAHSELKETLEDLKQTQAQLIQSEKMAALGQLIAGIAHEINTPMGAILASVSNISDALNETLEQFPRLFQILSEDRQEIFSAMVRRASENHANFTAREERKLKRSLTRVLEQHGFDDADSIADTLTDAGISEGIEDFLPLFRHSESDFILKTLYDLTSLKNGTKNIATAADRASKVVFALKTYARFDVSAKPVSTDLAEGIETILTLYRNQLKCGIEVIRNYKTLPPVFCYHDELNQVWTNIIHNAVQAMEGKGTLEIDVFRERESAVVTFTDSGKGIPDEIKARIFDPFFTTKGAGEGSGLGLDIVRKIIERHGGEIQVESEPGKTAFTIMIPVQQDA